MMENSRASWEAETEVEKRVWMINSLEVMRMLRRIVIVGVEVII
jgi:hypothetical protein